MNPWMEDLKARFHAEPIKISVMGVLLAVGLLLWGRLLLKDPPQVVTADPIADVVATTTGASPAESSAELPLPVIEIEVPSGPPRDLFASPRPERSVPSEQTAEKSQPETTDTPVRERVRELAGQLRLQAVIGGQQPRAVINGLPLQLGESIEGFTLRTVGSGAAELEREGVIVRLWVRPGS